MGPIFDQEHALRITAARIGFLGEWLPGMLRDLGAKTALDVGCGVGHFSRYLADLGLEVTGIDSRSGNVEEARRRHADVRFEVADITDRAVRALGRFDLVLCVGVMYHLEDPFAALRNVEALTGGIAVIESMVIPSAGPSALLLDEGPEEDQSMRGVAMVPSEPALVKMAIASGFGHVYSMDRLPDHDDFRPTRRSRPRRTFLVASRSPLSHPWLRARDRQLVPDPWERPFARVGRFIGKPLPEKLVTLRRLLRRA